MLMEKVVVNKNIIKPRAQRNPPSIRTSGWMCFFGSNWLDVLKHIKLDHTSKLKWPVMFCPKPLLNFSLTWAGSDQV